MKMGAYIKDGYLVLDVRFPYNIELNRYTAKSLLVAGASPRKKLGYARGAVENGLRTSKTFWI